jgi:hypothetical protein
LVAFRGGSWALVIDASSAGGLVRILSLILLAAQAFLWGAAPVLDAPAEARSTRATTHVEEHGNPSCPPVHGPSECQICRTLSSGAFTSAMQQALPADAKSSNSNRPQRVFATAEWNRGALGSRAPPLPSPLRPV